MKNKIALIVALAFVTFNTSYAQWVKISNIPAQEIVALANMNDTLYAASRANLIYKSMDAGSSWSSKIISAQPIKIYSLKIIDNEIYVGTINNGIFTSTDFGASWSNYSSSLPAVSGFEKFNDNIYASTVGNGVYKYDPNINQWFPFNNQLPSNISYNVETIVSTSNKLLIGAGGNGTFYEYDFNSDQWVLGYYYGGLSPGLIINKIINNSDILFALNNRRVIRSNDGGLNWVNDKTGTRDGVTRNAFLGAYNIYLITNLLNGGTWIQKRNKTAAVGTNWSVDEELLPSGYSYDILEFQGKLFLAKDDGLYVKYLTLGNDNPISIEKEAVIFPNPSKDGTIKISSPVEINNITISNLLGQVLYTAMVMDNNFEVPQSLEKGLYLVTIVLSNNQQITKKTIIE
jgi:hypothetical protein